MSSPEKEEKVKKTVTLNQEEMSIDTSILTKLMSDDGTCIREYHHLFFNRQIQGDSCKDE